MPKLSVVLDQVEEPPLRNLESTAVGRRRRVDNREARLEDPRVHHLAHGLARRRLERVPQIAGLGVVELMLLQVEPDAVAENVLAEKLLEHPQHRRTLLVSQDVEHRAAIFGTAHCEFDRPRAAQPVDRHRRRARDAEALPSLPLRLPRVHREHLHEGGERFVEPDAVPPAHRDQIAEPHVRVLVRNHVGNALELGPRRGFLVGQQRGLAKRDRAEIFHRARREIGNRDQVELVARILEAVIVGEIFERERANLPGPTGQRLFARNVNDPQRRARIDRCRRVELADDERDQVGGHRDRLLEDDLLLAATELALALLPAVRDRREVLIDDQRHLVTGLELRLVPARKRAARVGRFELRRRGDVSLAGTRPGTDCDRSRAACRSGFRGTQS